MRALDTLDRQEIPDVLFRLLYRRNNGATDTGI